VDEKRGAAEPSNVFHRFCGIDVLGQRVNRPSLFNPCRLERWLVGVVGDGTGRDTAGSRGCNEPGWSKKSCGFPVVEFQQPSEAFTGADQPPGGGYHIGPSWDSACVLLPWYLHLYHGDIRVLAQHCDLMKRYVDFLRTRAKDHIVSYGLGDWMYPKTSTPAEVTSTGYYSTDALILSKAAALLGKRDEAEQYGALAEQIRKAFHARLYKGDGTCANGSQTAQSCPLQMGLAPDPEREAVIRQLVAAVEKQDSHIDVGIIGIKYLLTTLAANGRNDVAYRIANQTTPPSWGDWLRRGATTMWEDWPGRSSHNHYAFGTVGEWLFKALAGIEPDESQPGFKHFIIHPRPVGDLKWVQAGYQSIRGRIESAWRREEGQFELRVLVPPNTTATVYVPTRNAASVTESRRPLGKVTGAKFLRLEDDNAVLEVHSGAYRFQSR